MCTNPNCGATTGFRQDDARGEISCGRCGRVAMDKMMYEGEEKITFAESEENHSRTQQVSEYTDDLSTTVADGGGGMSSDPSLAAGKAILMRQTKAQDPKTKALLAAKTSITTFSEKLDIPERVRQKARAIFKAYLDSSKRKPKNANSDAMILAILYMALKEEGFTRDFSDLASVSKGEGDQSSQIKRSYGKLKKGLPNREGMVGKTASDLVSRFCVNLEFPENLKTIAIEVAKKASSELEGKFPSSVAAASILYAAEAASYPLTAQEVAKATGSLKASTIKNSYKTLTEKKKEDLLPSDFDELVKFSKVKK
jgi:transcription initiation factor TFIIIB Brf1 subunit/transcription initiation factor TFIIB